MEDKPKVIKAKSTIKQKLKNRDIEEDIKTRAARLCFHYPQYSYMEALDLPDKTLKRLLKVADQELAKNYLNLLNISIAPNAKNGKKAVEKLKDAYNEVIEK